MPKRESDSRRGHSVVLRGWGLVLLALVASCGGDDAPSPGETEDGSVDTSSGSDAALDRARTSDSDGARTSEAGDGARVTGDEGVAEDGGGAEDEGGADARMEVPPSSDGQAMSDGPSEVGIADAAREASADPDGARGVDGSGSDAIDDRSADASDVGVTPPPLDSSIADNFIADGPSSTPDAAAADGPSSTPDAAVADAPAGDATGLLGMPTFASTTPGSPSQSLNPTILGNADPGATVRLYGNGCTGTPLGTGVADSNGTFAIAVNVPANATSTIRGTATSGARVSPCSAGSISYVNDIAPPLVRTMSPLGAGVITEAVVTLTFSEALDPASVNASTLTLSSGGQQVTGSVVVTGVTLTFALSAAGLLAPDTTYTVTLGGPLADTAGNQVAPATWNFTTGHAVRLETGAGTALNPEVASDASGNAIVVWEQVVGLGQRVFANRYTPGSGWSGAQIIDSSGAFSAGGPKIGVDDAGRFFVVWQQGDGTRNNIWFTRYIPGTGWETPAAAETDDVGSAGRPQLGIDSNGNAMIVWDRLQGTQSDIWANRYEVGQGWGTAGPIESTATKAYNSIIAVGKTSAIALWQQGTGAAARPGVNRYVVGVGWETAGLIASTDSLVDDVAVDDNGNAIALFEFHNTTTNRYRLMAVTYTPGVGWAAARFLDDGSGDAAYGPVRINASGKAIVSWGQDNNGYHVWAASYAVGGTWTPAQVISNGNGVSPSIGLTASGKAVTAWVSGEGVTERGVAANRYDGALWGTSQVVGSPGVDEGQVKVAIDANGNAVIAWQQYDGAVWNIWATTF